MKLRLLLPYVEDFPTVRAFYRDVLGLETTDVGPGPGHTPGVNSAQLAGNGGTIELFDHADFGKSRDFPLPRRNSVVVTFEVQDVDEAVERLRTAGCRRRADPSRGVGIRGALLRPRGKRAPALPRRLSRFST